MEDGQTNDELFELTKIDPWWLSQLRDLFDTSMWLKTKKLGELTLDEMEGLKKKGFSDVQIARYVGGCREGPGACRPNDAAGFFWL